MYRNKSRRCDHRIVSISQPYVRPIIRGKLDQPVEFGAKLSVSLSGEGLGPGWITYAGMRFLKAVI